jgi:hypothetical protein
VSEGDDVPAGRRRHRLRPVELLAVLRRHKVDFIIIGGFSLAAHGYVRATKDIDIVPDPEPDNIARLAGALRDLDAEPDLGDLRPDELGVELGKATLADGGNWVLRTRFGRLDVMQDVPGLRDYEQLRNGAIRVEEDLYAGYDELISMKAASGREEDLRDIAALKAARRS